MRISERQRYRQTNDRVENARSANMGSLEQISTLKKINRISDDPIGVGKVIRYKDRLKSLGQFKSNVEFSKGYLEKTEAAIQNIADNLIRAQELAVSLSNATYDDASRKSAAKEVKQIINEVVSSGNTTYAGRHIFSGYRTQTPALSTEGSYLGDDGAVFLQVDDGEFKQVNLQARYLFESSAAERDLGHFNMVDSLDILHTGLVNDDIDGIRLALHELNHQIQKTTSYQATLGSLYHSLDSSEKKIEADSVATTDLMSQIEEVDMFKASSDFHRSETVLQSTLLASNKMLQPSLLNFMQ